MHYSNWRIIIILTVICVAASFNSFSAANNESIAFPKRLEWHNVEEDLDFDEESSVYKTYFSDGDFVRDVGDVFYFRKDVGRGFFAWDSGQYLRIQLSGKNRSELSQLLVWASSGDGLFERLEPHSLIENESNKKSIELVFVKEASNFKMVMVEKPFETDSQVFFALQTSKETVIDNLNIHQEPIATPPVIKHGISHGFQWDHFRSIRQNERWSIELEGPMEYTFEWKAPWYTHFGSTYLMELSFEVDSILTNSEVVRMFPENNHLTKMMGQRCLFSKLNERTIYIPEGKHLVSVISDRDIQGHWLESASQSQLFYTKNEPFRNTQSMKAGLIYRNDLDSRVYDKLYSIERRELHSHENKKYQSRKIDESFIENRTNLVVPNTFFWRDLNPNQFLPLRKISIYDPKVSSKLLSVTKRFLGVKEIHSQYFHTIEPQKIVQYDVPMTTESPPLKLQFHPTQDEADFQIISDANEAIDVKFIPAAANDINERSFEPVGDHLDDAFIHETHVVSSQVIRFKKPYRQLSLLNRSGVALNLHLSYRNWSERKTDDYGFSSAVTQKNLSKRLTQIREGALHLKSLDSKVYNEDSDFRRVDNKLLMLEFIQWNRRLVARQDSFLERYSDIEPSENPNVVKKRYQTFIQRLNKEFNRTISDLPSAIALLNEKGFFQQADNLVVTLAMQIDGAFMQDEAESILIRHFDKRQAWASLEGYWAYRFLKYKSERSITPIAETLFQQGVFESASKWFWLAHLNKTNSVLPESSIVSAVKSNYYLMADQWIQQGLISGLNECQNDANNEPCQLAMLSLFEKQFFSKKLEPKVESLQREQLLLNTKLDLYMGVIEVDEKNPLSIVVDGPMRLEIDSFLLSDTSFSLNEKKIDWLTVELSSGKRRYLLSPLADSKDLVSATVSKRVISSPRRVTIDIPEGRQKISLQSEAFPMLLRFKQQVNLFGEIDQMPKQNSMFFGRSLIGKFELEEEAQPQFDTPKQCMSPKSDMSSMFDGAFFERLMKHPDRERYRRSIRHYWDSLASPTNFIDNQYFQRDSNVAFINQLLKVDSKEMDLDVAKQMTLHAIAALEYLDERSKLELTGRLNWKLESIQKDSELRILIRQLNNAFRWQKVTNVVESDGYSVIDEKRWIANTDFSKVVNALMTQKPKENERLLSRLNKRVISLTSSNRNNYYLTLKQMKLFAYPNRKVTVEVKVNGFSKSVELTPGKSQELTLKMREGKNRIELIQQSDHRGWVFYNVNNTSKTASVLPTKSSKFFRGTKEQPLVVFFEKGRWIKVDEFYQGRLVDSYTKLITRSNNLNIFPKRNEGLLKVYQWQGKDDVNHGRKYSYKSSQQSSDDDDESELEVDDISKNNRPIIHTRWFGSTFEQLNFVDKYDFAQQEDGTWGLGFEVKKRTDFDEDTQSLYESFSQVNWNYRLRVKELESYFRSNLGYRRHSDEDLQTLLTDNEWIWWPNKFWQLEGRMKGFYQLTSEDNVAESASSQLYSITGSLRMYWHDDVKNKISMSHFERVMNRSGFESDVSVDDDVFSKYKSQHRRGVVISDTLTYLPWADTQLYGLASIRTNESMSLSDIDQRMLSFGISQYYDSVYYNLSFDYRMFSKDEFRQRDYKRKNIGLDLVWEKWTNRGERWNIRLDAQYDLEKKEPLLGIRFEWNTTHGQGFDDFSPKELRFSNIRERKSYYDIESNLVERDEHE